MAVDGSDSDQTKTHSPSYETHGTILVAEDTPIQAKKLVYYLEKFGHTVKAVENGKLALDELMSKPDDYDLIITDIQMPVMDGLEFLAAVRNEAQLHQLPVVVLTTLQEEEVCLKAFSLGTSDFLTKPFRPEELKLRSQNLIMLYRFQRMLVEENYVLGKSLMRKNQILERNLEELKKANEDLKDLQNRLVIASKMASIGVLSAGVAHEINNPLAIIQGYNERLSDMIQDDEAKPEDLKSINGKISKASDRISSIVKSLQKLAGTSTDSDPTVSDVSVNIAIQDLSMFYGEMAAKHKVTVSFELCNENPFISGSLNSFQQVLLNLIYNGIDAMTESKSRTLTVSTKVDDAFGVGGKVIIDVTDTGLGIPAEIVDRIFEPFFTTKSPGKGPGLGLSLVYTFAKELGGDIQCLPQATGTCFRLTLPLKTSAKTETKKKAA